jgi:hypothetical protein
MGGMYALLTLVMILASNAGTDAGASTEQGGSAGADAGFVEPFELPLLAYPAIAALVLLALLAITFAFRNTASRH